MATEQEELEQNDSSSEGVSSDFPTVQEVDQGDIPHHPAADPDQETPNQVGVSESE